MIIGICGKSGSGKTTLGKALYKKLITEKNNIIFLDGDDLRQIFCDGLGYTYDERKICAFRYARLCAYLSMQNMDVICSTVSMFNDVRYWNRKNIIDYCEIYLKCNEETLVKRDYKQVYNKRNVVGIDIKAEFPEMPDLTFFDDDINIDSIVNQILQWRDRYDKN